MYKYQEDTFAFLRQQVQTVRPSLYCSSLTQIAEDLLETGAFEVHGFELDVDPTLLAAAIAVDDLVVEHIVSRPLSRRLESSADAATRNQAIADALAAPRNPEE